MKRLFLIAILTILCPLMVYGQPISGGQACLPLTGGTVTGATTFSSEVTISDILRYSPALGSENVTIDNSCTNWTLGAGWVCGGDGTLVRTTGWGEAVYTGWSPTASNTYELKFTVTNWGNDGLRGNLGGYYFSDILANGSYTRMVKAASTGQLTLTPMAENSYFKITSASVKQRTGTSATRLNLGGSTDNDYFAAQIINPLGAGLFIQTVEDGTLTHPSVVFGTAMSSGSRITTMFDQEGRLYTSQAIIISGDFTGTITNTGVSAVAAGTSGLSAMLDVISDTDVAILARSIPTASGGHASIITEYKDVGGVKHRGFSIDSDNQVNLYGAYTDASNYEGLAITATAGSVTLAAQTAGTGTDNIDIAITPAGTGKVQIGLNAATASAQTIKGADSSTASASGGDLILSGGTPGAGGVDGRVIIRGAKGYPWIPAGSMTPITSAGLATVSQAPNMTDYLAFDGGTDEYAGFTLSLEDWDLSTIKAKFVWYASAAMTNGHTVIWGLNCYAVSDGDTSDVAFDTGAVTVSDAYATSDETGPIQKTSAATAAITVQGTPAAGDVVYCRVSRDADTDTSTIDAWLVGVKIEYGKTVPTAW